MATIAWRAPQPSGLQYAWPVPPLVARRLLVRDAPAFPTDMLQAHEDRSNHHPHGTRRGFPSLGANHDRAAAPGEDDERYGEPTRHMQRDLLSGWRGASLDVR